MLKWGIFRLTNTTLLSVSIMSVNQELLDNECGTGMYPKIFTMGRTILVSHPLASPAKRPIL
ncbi:hypothetical protein SAMN05192533_11752 [Mesobacillus persicus]|jgi:hypothetical protein|uniref:Uncharacterized protein n=1 Tax=Mesobacillus persicus TaxID=930146 RepID=A0A1H8II04_9BACI|nr:hypothetical protein SAMN05192533_11752 [Mesobacillus persicus]